MNKYHFIFLAVEWSFLNTAAVIAY